MAKKKIEKIGNNRQYRQKYQDIFSTIAVGQVAPQRGEERARGVAHRKNQSHGHGRKTELGEIDREDDAQVRKREGAHAAGGHQDEHVPLQTFRAEFHEPGFALRYLSRSRSSSVLIPSACSVSLASAKLSLCRTACAGRARVSKSTLVDRKKVSAVSGVSLTLLSPPRIFCSPQAPLRQRSGIALASVGTVWTIRSSSAAICGVSDQPPSRPPAAPMRLSASSISSTVNSPS